MTDARFDAAIVGAGPAGSASAILLAHAGWSVALIERQAFPRRKVCGECIAASNLPLLHALGVGAEDALIQASTASFVAPLVEETTKGVGLLVHLTETQPPYLSGAAP